MLLEVIQFLSDEVNSYMNLKYGLEKNIVEITNLTNQDGSMGSDKNKIIMSMISLEEEAVKQLPKQYERNDGRSFTRVHVALNLNFYIMFVAYFEGEDYKDGLKYLRGVIGYFQSNRSYSAHQFAQLGNETHKLTTEIVNLDMDSLGRLWPLFGNKYLPSIIYKVKTLNIQDDLGSGQVSGITAANNE